MRYSSKTLGAAAAPAVATLVLAVAAMTGAPVGARADVVRVAVASNFAGAMKAVAERFEASTGHEVTLVFGSTGSHYAQIWNGAPLDAFFAADTLRPASLERDSLAVAGSRFTYAVGKLVLWSTRPDFVDAAGDILRSSKFRHIAVANPRLAPYGRAAREILEARGLWDSLSERIVQGENVAQAYQLVHSGNAELGFIAYSQLLEAPAGGSWWEIPPSMHAPIEQQAVLLAGAGDAARSFVFFVRSEEARRIIRNHGYATDDAE